MGNTLIYAGIGSRETPDFFCSIMKSIARQLAPRWVLRSGFADGADMAFCRGADEAQGEMEIYVPWAGFNGAPTDDDRIIVPEWTNEIFTLAAKHHPAWHRCSSGARKLHARNGCQVLGRSLLEPAHMVICWTPEGKGNGGTGQAIRIANEYEIPVFDLAIPGMDRKLCEFVERMERLEAGEWEMAA
jgi:hypothetical protein